MSAVPAAAGFGERFRENGQAAWHRIARVKAAGTGLSRRAVVPVLVAVVLVVATAIRLDPLALGWVATLHAPTRSFFRHTTRFGQSDWLLIPSGIAVILLLLGAWRRIDRRIAAAWTEIGILLAAFFFVVAVSGITVDIVKTIVGRERPLLFGIDGPFAFVPFSAGYETNGFPSGHATTMGAVIVFVAFLSRVLAVPVLVLGLIVALSRVVVEAHYPSDVVAGFLFGGAYAYLFVLAMSRARVGFSPGVGGAPHPRSGALARIIRRRGVGALFSGLRDALLP